MWGFVKTILFKIYFNMIGSWYMTIENVVRPRRLPNYVKSDRTIVITGGGRGIGEEAVRKFLKLGYKVIIGCRSPEKVQKMYDNLISQDRATYTGSVTCLFLDLMSLATVRTFAKSVLDIETKINILINNAGIMVNPVRKETEDGYESQFATNYVGHFLLTHLLLPAMIKTSGRYGTGRIVNVSSAAHYMGSWLDWSDIHLKNYYSPEQAYGNSKAAQILTTKHIGNMMDKLGHDIKVISIHPGIVNTDLYEHVAGMKYINWLRKLIMKTAEQGGDTIVHAAIDPDLPTWGQGLHLENHRKARVSSFCQNKNNQDKIFQFSCTMMGINKFGQ